MAVREGERPAATISRTLSVSCRRQHLPVFVQEGLDLRGVLRAAADQDLASGREFFQNRVGVKIEGLGLDQGDRYRNRRGGQQVVDDFDQAVVEVALRIAEPLVSFLKEGIKVLVDSHHLLVSSAANILTRGV